MGQRNPYTNREQNSPKRGEKAKHEQKEIEKSEGTCRDKTQFGVRRQNETNAAALREGNFWPYARRGILPRRWYSFLP